MTKITLPPGALQEDHGKPKTDEVDRKPTKELRQPAPNVIDQRQQQIDPAGNHRADDDARDDSNTKQPGGSQRPSR